VWKSLDLSGSEGAAFPPDLATVYVLGKIARSLFTFGFDHPQVITSLVILRLLQ